jgi:hypothetical protein
MVADFSLLLHGTYYFIYLTNIATCFTAHQFLRTELQLLDWVLLGSSHGTKMAERDVAQTV